MAKIIIELNDTQYKGIEYIAVSPEEWGDNVVTNRARIAIDEIVKIYTERALDEGVQIPATRELIVADAFTRDWVKTAKKRNEELEKEKSSE